MKMAAVEVSMRSLGNVQIDSRNGDINLSVPDKAGFRVDARTREGEIQSDFPEVKIDNDDHESKASGSVGNGASHIVLNNEHDGIEIRKASAKAAIAAPATPATPASRPGPCRRQRRKSNPRRTNRMVNPFCHPERSKCFAKAKHLRSRSLPTHPRHSRPH